MARAFASGTSSDAIPAGKRRSAPVPGGVCILSCVEAGGVCILSCVEAKAEKGKLAMALALHGSDRRNRGNRALRVLASRLRWWLYGRVAGRRHWLRYSRRIIACLLRYSWPLPYLPRICRRAVRGKNRSHRLRCRKWHSKYLFYIISDARSPHRCRWRSGNRLNKRIGSGWGTQRSRWHIFHGVISRLRCFLFLRGDIHTLSCFLFLRGDIRSLLFSA